jgi:molybdopterin-guanine dinucleotide biosynthesis protein A
VPSLALIGVLVGGAGRRMGGVPKGNLLIAGVPLVQRAISEARLASTGSERDLVCVVGDSSAYRLSDVDRLADSPPGIGPLGGLRSLLVEAQRLGCDAIALAVDMPHVRAPLLRRLIEEQPEALALAPRSSGHWEPLLARYRPAAALPVVDALIARDERSLQAVFHALGSAARELVLEPGEREALADWDRPEDVTSTYPKGTTG